MQRTKFTQDGNRVQLQALDPDTGNPIDWTFWIPRNGGYIRCAEWADRQVCVGLSTRGITLEAKDGAHLARILRQEWRAYRDRIRGARLRGRAR